jgi:hypothetical protein
MTKRPNGRQVISVTMQADLHSKLYEHCKKIDIPVSVFVREAIKNHLQDAST